MTETNLACAFPGQGIQKPGMAEHLVGTKAWSCFDQASELVGYDLGQLCLEGPQAALDNTAKAQVAIFVTCYALWELYKENYNPKLFLGHSLGEITALGAAGAFSFAQGVTLVKARGEAMGKASHQGGMSAIIGLDPQAVDEVCLAARDHGHVQIANENSPNQIVVSGEVKALEQVARLAREKGARRVVQLNVSGAFHSSLMEPAAKEFAQVVEELELQPCHTPVLSNDAETLLTDPETIRANLVKQITSPVKFTGSVEKLVQLGIETFVEVSPESLLTPLARRTSRDLQFSLVRDGGM